jgi:hypothetical protein
MMITLINCKPYLEALGIYMEQTGSGELLSEKLSEKIAWLSWEYNFRDYTLYISVEEGTVIPDLSEFGEVVTNDGY